MIETHYVAVFDPESCDLCRLPASKIDTNQYEKIRIPRRKSQFDLYAIKDPEKQANKGDTSNYAVISRSTDDPKGKSHLARLYYSRLGIASDLQRLVSPKYRTLYIGAIPEA
ncbi:MAG: hypothetical protein L6R40_005522 [Gallowayella cf. fulva]|nr:MAG: hypothetical protein L6R40_005522 [Xanthomendoza cf. fulva]